MRWLVDGMNVIGSRPDGWWRDRRAAQRRLVGELAVLVGREGDEVTVVFDGSVDPAAVDAGRVRGVAVVFAPGGPDAADRVIAAMVRGEAGTTGDRAVVTSDAGLAREVRAMGVGVVGAASFLRRLTSGTAAGSVSRPASTGAERHDGHGNPDM